MATRESIADGEPAALATPAQYRATAAAHERIAGAFAAIGKQDDAAQATVASITCRACALRPLCDAPTADVIALVEALQSVQKGNRPTSVAWKLAHEQLAPLFAEMARRTARGAA